MWECGMLLEWSIVLNGKGQYFCLLKVNTALSMNKGHFGVPIFFVKSNKYNFVLDFQQLVKCYHLHIIWWTETIIVKTIYFNLFVSNILHSTLLPHNSCSNTWCPPSPCNSISIFYTNCNVDCICQAQSFSPVTKDVGKNYIFLVLSND